MLKTLSPVLCASSFKVNVCVLCTQPLEVCQCRTEAVPSLSGGAAVVPVAGISHSVIRSLRQAFKLLARLLDPKVSNEEAISVLARVGGRSCLV